MHELRHAVRAAAGGQTVLAPAALTGRELEVLELVARGASNREVGGHCT